MSLLDRIAIEPGKCGVHRYIRVMDVLELLAAGASHEGILADYAFL